MHVVLITESGVTLQIDGEDKFYVIKNLNDVTQFEIDQALLEYEPHFHYFHEPGP